MNNPGAEAASDQQVTSQLVVASTSRAADGGYLALRDLSEIADAMGVEYRVVGGHMVTLLATLHGVSDQVPLRETTDADLGVSPQVVADPRLPQALRDRNYALSGAANRFVRDRDGGRGRLEVVIDVLAPSYRGGLRSNQRHGDLFVDEIPGLAFALSRPPTTVVLRVHLLDGDEVAMHLSLPDLTSALCLKALAYRGRFEDKDAVDLWRLMCAAHAAGLRAESWPATVTGRDAGHVLHRFFGRPGAAGLKQVSPQRSDQARMRALVRATVAPPQEAERVRRG
jgi:hypothetical protein